MGENWRLRSPVFFGGGVGFFFGGLRVFFFDFFRSDTIVYNSNGILPNVKEIFSNTLTGKSPCDVEASFLTSTEPGTAAGRVGNTTTRLYRVSGIPIVQVIGVKTDGA